MCPWWLPSDRTPHSSGTGEYDIVFSRGHGDELTAPLTLTGERVVLERLFRETR